MCPVPIARLRRRVLLRGVRRPGARDGRRGTVAGGAPGDRPPGADLGAMAAVSDRGHRRYRNEDAVAVAVAADRFVAWWATASRPRPIRTRRPRRQPPRHSPSRAPDLHARMARIRPARGNPRGGLRGGATRRHTGARRRTRRERLSPSTTLVAAVDCGTQVVVGNMGDSRAYWLSGDHVHGEALTVDDSWAEESIADGVDRRWPTPTPTPTRSRGGSGTTPICDPHAGHVQCHRAGSPCRMYRWAVELLRRPGTPSRPHTGRPGSAAGAGASPDRRRAAAGGHDNVTVAVVPLGPGAPRACWAKGDDAMTSSASSAIRTSSCRETDR